MKRVKKLLVFALALVMVATTLVTPANSDAARNLNKKKVKMYVGQTMQLYVTGATSKVKWSSSKKKVASVSKKGVVKAKKKGKAKITAKYGKKKMYCTVVVRKQKNSITNPVVNTYPTAAPTMSPQEQIIANNALAANVAVKAEKLPSGQILYTITNNNTTNVSKLKVSTLLNDANGAPVDTYEFNIYDLMPGTSDYELYDYSSKCALIDVARSTISVSVTQDKTYRTYSTESVNVTGARNADGAVILTNVNSIANKVTITGMVFFRDAAGAVVAAKEIYESVDAGATVFTTISKPTYRYDMPEHESYDPVEYVNADWKYRAYYYAY